MKTLYRHNPDQTMREVESHMLLDDVRRAETAAGNIIAHHPEHLPARLRRAAALLRLGRAEEALKDLDAVELYRQTVVEIPHRRLNVWLRLRARAMIQLDRPRQARALLEEAVKLKSDSTAMRMLGILMLRLNDPPAAVEWLTRAVGADTMDSRTIRWLAEAQERAGRPEEALHTLRQLGRLPRSWRRHVARLMQRAGRTVQAVELYERLIGEQPHNAALAVEAAALAGQLGEDQRACGYLQTALSGHPADSGIMTALASQHMRCGRFVSAGRLWWKLHCDQPRDPVPLANLAVCAAAESRDRLVQRVTRRLHRVNGNQALCRVLVAQAYQQATPGRLLTDILERKPAAAAPSVLDGLLTDATRTFEATLEHHNYADLHYHLGMAHGGLGRIEAAEACLDEALRINPKYRAAADERAKLAA